MGSLWCDICDQLRPILRPEAHTCPPFWLIFTHGEDEHSARVRARDQHEAAERYLSQHHVDHDYCETVEIEIAPEHTPEAREAWVVEARMEPTYHARKAGGGEPL